MTIKVYAILKEFFAREFVIAESITGEVVLKGNAAGGLSSGEAGTFRCKQPSSIAELRSFLVQINPNSEAVLNSSRFAVADEFVGNDHKLNDNDNISIMPPSSGG